MCRLLPQRAFIHNVTPGRSKTGDGGHKHTYVRGGIGFFDTYVGAAIAAYKYVDPVTPT